MSRAKFGIMLALAVVAVLLAPAARADTFDLNVAFCTTGCIGQNTSAGTVTLTQVSPGVVDIRVDLVDGLEFHKANGPGSLTSFVFNSTVDLSEGDIAVTNGGGSSWTFLKPAGNADGAGTFQYGFNCASAPNGCVGDPNIFEFRVTATGLTPGSFEIRPASNTDFAANVAFSAATGCTGMVGAGNGPNGSTATASTGTCNTPTVPEPTSIAFFGTGLIGLGFVLRTRLKSVQ